MLFKSIFNTLKNTSQLLLSMFGKVRAVFLVFLLICTHLLATDIYVSPLGNDTNKGCVESPKAKLAAALRQAREMRQLNATGIENGIRIILKGGTFHFYEPLYVRPKTVELLNILPLLAVPKMKK